MCEWQPVCKIKIKEINDCTQVYWVGTAMQKGLHKLGIKTPDDLAAQDPEHLKIQVRDLIPQGYFWKGMPENLINKSIQRAKIFKSGKHVIHSKIDFPDHQFEIHYDLEDDPTQDFVYLHGIVLAEKGKKPEYHAFFAESMSDEESITKQLFDFLKKYAGSPVYHYSAYEKTTLKRLIGKYSSLDQSVFEMLFGKNGTAIDLMKIVNDKTDWPLSSYSLKDICRYLGFQWDAEDASGAASIVWMNDYLNGKTELKPKMLRYNEDDCTATYFLKQSLEKMQKR
jgi:predicted RecB family nuclease